MSILARHADFSVAISAARCGLRIRREGWNGKGMWVCQGDGSDALEADKFWNYHTRRFAECNGGAAPVPPYMIMRTAQGEIQMGWLASQSDMLARDWQVIDDQEPY